MIGFDKAFALVVGSEGGYSNDLRDPGGETKFGISKRAYPQIDIANLTMDKAAEIYKRDYWDKVHGDELPYAWALCLFDCAVNQGVEPCIHMAQDAVGAMVDGNFGPRTVTAIQNADDRMLARFLAKRALRYESTPNATTYGFGWLTRLFVRAFDAHKGAA